MVESFVDWLKDLPVTARVAMFLALAAGTHLAVILIRRLVMNLVSTGPTRSFSKLRTVGTLIGSFAIFGLYFLAGGLILRELGVSLTAYLASASVLGLAIGFGSQGIVQDVVTGVTLIFSDLIDVGDLVEVSGQTGVVQAITMRFVVLRNALGASVFIPNRTISNVINYPRGYVRCIVDVTLPGDDGHKNEAEQAATRLMLAIHDQYPGILITEPSVEGRIQLNSGREILRVKFRIWPNRGGPIETTFVQELNAKMKQLDEAYQPWMISVTYEVERVAVRPRQKSLWGKRT